MRMNTMEQAAKTEALWREFRERLRAFVSRRVKRLADVEDILQEVFVHIHRHLGTVQQRDRLPAWVFQITRNAIADHYRRVSRVNAEGLKEEFERTAPPEMEDPLRESSKCVEPMVAGLADHSREARVLTDLQGMTQQEAAVQIGLSLSGMKSRVQRARRQLKKMFLECCRVELDRRGGIVDYSLRDPSKSPCGEPCRKPGTMSGNLWGNRAHATKRKRFVR
jgi:RNA polymerase sigma-70 factor (ECF subfamily)